MPRRVRRKIRDVQKKIAKERVGILFNLAEGSALSGDIAKADVYVEYARKIAMRYKLRIPREYKGKYCKYCYKYLQPSVTSIVRINPKEHRVEVKCLKCGKRVFHPFIRELKEKREDESENKRGDKDTAHRKTGGNRESAQGD